MTLQPLCVESDRDRSQEIDISTDFVNYLTLGYVSKNWNENGWKSSDISFGTMPTNSHDQTMDSKSESGDIGTVVTAEHVEDVKKEPVQPLVSHWSFPLRLLANENGCRMTSSLVVEDSSLKYEAICVSGTVKDGVTYFTIQIDTAPVCFIENQCPFPLYYGQTLMNLSLKSKSQFKKFKLLFYNN